MKDFLGNNLEIGDAVIVACYDSVKGAKLLKGVINKSIGKFAHVTLETEPGCKENFLISLNRIIKH